MAQLPADDTGGQIATFGTILAAIAAGLAAVWRLSVGSFERATSDTRMRGIDASVDRTVKLLEAASVIIDQLQQENSRLIGRLGEMDNRIQTLEAVIRELRNGGPSSGRRKS